jgi:hypothetical protein
VEAKFYCKGEAPIDDDDEGDVDDDDGSQEKNETKKNRCESLNSLCSNTSNSDDLFVDVSLSFRRKEIKKSTQERLRGITSPSSSANS